MSAHHRLTASAWLPCATALLMASMAQATCIPDIIYKRYVGTDGLCTDASIQAAIDNAVCPSTIYITREVAWTSQHLDINNKNLVLVGTDEGCGPPTCTAGCVVPTVPLVTLSGSGHSGDSVLYIHGQSNVTLKYLEIRDGNNINGAVNTYGGGIHFDGRGSLVLDTTWLKNNVARFGGGINFNGNGGFAGMTVLAHSRIEGNTAANSGGGIRLSGNAFMSMLQDNTLVWLNDASNGFGGGINIVGPAHADIASPGESGLAVVYSNTAQFGGGVAITASDSGDAELQLFTIDPQRPGRISGNFASSRGGGVYLKSHTDLSLNFYDANLCAFDFRLDDNGAPEGSAVYADYDTDPIGEQGSWVWMNEASNFCTGLPPSAQRCAAGTTCNTVSGNYARDAASTPTLGAAILIDEDSHANINRVDARDNEGGYVVHGLGSANVDLANCLLAGNAVSRQLLRSDSGNFDIDSCTLVDNAILSTNSIYAGGPLTLANSIIDQPGNNALGYGGNPNDLLVGYVLSSDVTTLPAVAGVALGRPTYVNAAAGNYRLALNSLGIDFAPPIVGDDRDLDNNPHDQDLPEVGNLFGVRDLGAYERQRSCGAGDTIFCDGFGDP